MTDTGILATRAVHTKAALEKRIAELEKVIAEQGRQGKIWYERIVHLEGEEKALQGALRDSNHTRDKMLVRLDGLETMVQSWKKLAETREETAKRYLGQVEALQARITELEADT